jgi:subtilisin-like proprotein convertase family protein/subtilisin family serine protease
MSRSGKSRISLALGLAGVVLPLALFAARLPEPQPYTSMPPKLDAKHQVRGQPTVWLGDHYSVKDTRVELVRRVDQVVVQLRPQTDPGEALAALTRAGGPLAGFEQEMVFSGGLYVLGSKALAEQGRQSAQQAYARLGQAMSSLGSTSSVAWSAPVFVNAQLGTYAIATDEVLVRLRPGVKPEAFFNDTRFAGFERAASSDAFLARAASGAGQAALELAASLQGDPAIVWAEPNLFQERQRFFTPNDTLIADQWHLNNTGQGGGTPGADAKLFAAWDVVPSGASDMVIAIVDDGPEMTHPDLATFQNPGEISADGIDNDGNGYIDDMVGWDFTSAGPGDNNPGPSSNADEHGTAVAGVAAARGNNGAGVSGAAFGARIFASRIFDGAFATSDANIGSALAYAAGRGRNLGDNNWRGADVVNNSWGGGAPSSAINDALEWAAANGRNGLGTPNFFATGNNGNAFISEPAVQSAAIESVIAVGASDNFDLRSDYSQYGPEIDFLAPSNGGSLAITTTDRLGPNGYNGLFDQNYTNNFGGTSSATPLAAGVGALILSADPTLTVTDLRHLMRGNADKIGANPYVSGFNTKYGYGRINAAQAVQAVGESRIKVELDGIEVANGALQQFDAVALTPTTLTFTVTSVGTEELLLDDLAVAGDAAYSLDTDFGDATLSLGESTTFAVRIESAGAGSFAGKVSFTTNDDDNAAFSFPLEAAVAPLSVGGTVFEDWNGDGFRDAGDLPVAGQLVYLDDNVNGQFDPPIAFASPENLNILFSDETEVSHSIDVANLEQTLDSVSVQVNIGHTWVGDVRLRLQGPNGQVIVLAHRPGGPSNSGDDLRDTNFNDAASSELEFGSPPYTGDFRPLEPLAAFNGIDPNGQWSLAVSDMFPLADNGILQDWTLTLNAGGDTFTFSGNDGRYQFSALAPGNYTVRSEAIEWTGSSPVGGSHAVQVVGSESNAGLDFAQFREDAIYGRVYGDASGDGDFQDGEPLLESETVFLDGNADGLLENTVSGSASSAPGLAIPDADVTGVSDTIVIAEAGSLPLLSDLTVEVDITHPWVADLTLRLTAPDGSAIVLVANNGDDGDNFTNTILDDDAATSILDVDAGDAPFTGSFRPVEPLGTFYGSPINGVWTLTVIDSFGSDIGTLDSWTLDFEYQPEPSLETNAFGNYRFDVPPGGYDVRILVLDGFELSEPADGNYALTLAPGDSALNRDFGLLDNSPPVFVNTPYAFSVDELAAVDTAVGSVSAIDPNAADTLTYAITGGNTDGAFKIDAATGAISVENQAAVSLANGPFALTVQVTDPSDASAVADVAISVNDINQAPVAGTLPDVAYPVEAQVDIDASTAFTDPDSDVLAFSAIGLPASLTMDQATGHIVGTLLVSDEGTYEVTVTATDPGALFDTASFTLTVLPAPIFSDGFED